jgi:undecaprenyl-phosphate 4-deoxy-4-formamido-L-arabinose transferase
MDSISIIVPVFRSEDSIRDLYNQIISSLDSYRIEIIFIEDSGGDNSWNVISELAEKDDRVFGFQHAKNFGQHNALLLGIRYARYDYIVTIDDDLQNPPEEIPKLIEKLKEGYDVVYGVPEHDKHNVFRNATSRLIKFLLQKTIRNSDIKDTSSFRAFKAFVREAFDRFNNPYVSIDVLLSWGTNNFASVKVSHQKRKYGTSNYSFYKLVRHAVNMLIGYSPILLRLASIIGFTLTLFGILFLGYVLGSYILRGSNVPGFPFLASVISIFSGAQMFTIGILGEYLARIYFFSLGKPYSVVKNVVGTRRGE